jgi:ribulose-phosphate 3-epimerase
VSLPFDIHLMIEEPARHIQSFVEAGGDIINVHIEACPEFGPILQQVKGLDRKAGVCLNPGTPIDAIEGLLKNVDQVMVMGVNPGWGGQAFIPETLPKVRQLRALLDEQGLTTDVEIDGGVKAGNIAACVQAGANVLVAGSAVFNKEASVTRNIAALRAAAMPT